MSEADLDIIRRRVDNQEDIFYNVDEDASNGYIAPEVQKIREFFSDFEDLWQNGKRVKRGERTANQIFAALSALTSLAFGSSGQGSTHSSRQLTQTIGPTTNFNPNMTITRRTVDPLTPIYITGFLLTVSMFHLKTFLVEGTDGQPSCHLVSAGSKNNFGVYFSFCFK